MPDDVILETRKLTKEFHGFVAVNGVDLRIRRGAIHALIGPNGAGKTTVFNLLTRFLATTSGSRSIIGWEGAMKPTLALIAIVLFATACTTLVYTARYDIGLSAVQRQQRGGEVKRLTDPRSHGRQVRHAKSGQRCQT